MANKKDNIMLKNMENETKIFVAWLKKLVKLDKVVTARWVAGKVGVTPATISSYVTDRTKPNFKIRQAIIEAVGVDYEEVLRVGRQELLPPRPESDVMEEAAKEAIQKALKDMPIIDLRNQKNALHHQIIDKFKDQDLATEINSILLNIERLDAEELKVFRDYAKSRLNKINTEDKTKRNAG
ncbi:MAG: helix-turn-helix transcriptional regulator [Desulfobacteraceae bacterium]|nr:helix-turn-helix transcriptional regulator [Desulfobacteraceae bacterium]